MDFSSLETIVGKRKIPSPPENKKKRRRITPTLLPPDASSSTSSVFATDVTTATSLGTSIHQPDTSTTTVNYYYQQDKNSENDVSSQCIATIPFQLSPSSYNTSIGYFESTHIVKQKFYLSDTLYILVGLDMNEAFNPSIYIVDKKWWMQIQIDPDCMNTILYFRKRIDDFFATPRSCKDFHPLHTEKLKILPSKNSEPTIRLQRSRNHCAQTVDWEDSEINAIFNFIENCSIPEITMNREEWNNFMLLSESIDEYYNLASACKIACNRLLLQYVKYFKNIFRPMAVAANSQDQDEQVRVKEEMKNQIPIKVRGHHQSRLMIDPVEYNIKFVSPFGTWLDAELRVYCNETVMITVLQELSKEFTWLKD